jgi:hypothetical protein
MSVLRTAALRVPAIRRLYGSGKALLAERAGRLIVTEYPVILTSVPLRTPLAGGVSQRGYARRRIAMPRPCAA